MAFKKMPKAKATLPALTEEERLVKRLLLEKLFNNVYPVIRGARSHLTYKLPIFDAMLAEMSQMLPQTYDAADIDKLTQMAQGLDFLLTHLVPFRDLLQGVLDRADPSPYLLEPEPPKIVESEDEDEDENEEEDNKGNRYPSLSAVLHRALEPQPVTLLPLFDDQAEALEDILTWANDKTDDEPFYVLRGYAGTGKSTLMTHVVHRLGNLVCPTALTNKAARVLTDMLKAANLDVVKASTIYSVLKLVMKQEEDKLVLTKVEAQDAPIQAGTVYLVDECSMIPKVVLREIKAFAERHNVKFLFVGDPFQVNPVGEVRSPVWKLDAPNWQLTKIRRFDSSLLNLSSEIRRRIKEKVYHIDDLFFPSDEIKITKPTKYLTKVQDAFVATKGDDPGLRVIAWTNRRVNEYSNAIRSALGRTEPYEPGDSLMMAAPVQEVVSTSSRFNSTTKKIVAYTDDEVKVTSVTDGAVPVVLGDVRLVVPVHNLTVAGDYSGNLLIPKDVSAFDQRLSTLADEARVATGRERGQLWRSFWEAKEKFQSVRYAQAMTVHRSQGSTYREVFLDAGNVASNPNERERMKCLYVGASRPSKLLQVRL